MIVYCAFRAEPSQSPIVIKTEDKDHGLSVDEAKALIYNLEDAVACAEAGEFIRRCPCGRLPLIYEPEDGAGVWKVECTICRKRTDRWASKPKAVRKWNRMVEDTLLRKGPGIHRLMYANRTKLGFVPECLYTKTNGLYANPTEPTNCLSRRLNKSGSMRLMETIEDGSKAQIVLEDISPRDADAIHAFQLAGGKGRLVISESGITYEG